jgi:hypothetical protein
MKAFGLVDLFILIQNISYLFCYLYVLELRTTFFLMSFLVLNHVVQACSLHAWLPTGMRFVQLARGI